ncbi:hypothetical protein SADUNF_Sadunf11G0078600 [Salix dunnii]|uniref:Uncharacterized protein n=1 Tax=Salix dunnii TaxID=1413687 RepID=A0A835JQH6_9ROSI|nr:hypothetical protein SADUNF_Sadunf11G0078600 [Salix dunnii]
MDACRFMIVKTSFYGLGGIGKFVFNLVRSREELGAVLQRQTTSGNRKQDLQKRRHTAACGSDQRANIDHHWAGMGKGKSRASSMDVKAKFQHNKTGRQPSRSKRGKGTPTEESRMQLRNFCRYGWIPIGIHEVVSWEKARHNPPTPPGAPIDDFNSNF